MQRPTGYRFWALASLAIAGTWGLAAIVYTLVLDAQDRHDTPCFEDTFRAPESTAPVVDLGQTPERLTLAYGQSRGARTDQAPIDARGALPSPLQVDPTGLRGSGGTISSEYVHVRAHVLRGTILLDVCLDLRTTGRVGTGTYQGKAVFTDPRVSDLAVPITATVQARYLMYLAPLILIMPLLGLLLVWESVSQSGRANFGKGALAAYITALGAAAVVFNAQGLSNPGWGGALPFGALLAGMYAASTAATATFTSKARSENA